MKNNAKYVDYIYFRYSTLTLRTLKAGAVALGNFATGTQDTYSN